MAATQLKELNLRLVGLARVLQDRQLAVPLYQRSYSWKPEQVEAFWADLQAALMSGAPDYFMGTIVLSSEETTGQARGRVTVIDGQQRLATVSILLACMRDALATAGDPKRARVVELEFLLTADLRTGEPVPRLLLNSEDAEFFASRILQPEHPDDAADGDGNQFAYVSNQRLLSARKILAQRVQTEIDAAGPNWMNRIFDWIEFLQERVRVISILVESEADAFLIFETLNDRGLGLTIADLLKNHLLSLARNGADPDSVHALWMAMLASFPADREDDDDALITTFIRHYWSSLHGPTRERELYRSLKRRVKGPEQAADLVGALSASAPSYAALLDADHYRWQELGVERPLSDTVLRFALEQPRPLLLAALDLLEGDQLRLLLRAVVSWSTRGLIVGGIGGGTTERYYANAAEAVRNSRARRWTDVASIVEPIVPTDEVFRAAFANKRVNSPRLAKYYLAAIEGGTADSAVVTDRELDDLMLVHILPRRAPASSWPGFPRETLGQWALRLGNQVLLERRQTWRPEDFQSQKARLEESPRPLAASVRRERDWDARLVGERQDAMAAMAVEIWPRLVG